MTSTTAIIITNRIKPQTIRFFLLGGVTIALFLLATTTNLLQQQEQSNMASVELVDGAEGHPARRAAKQDFLKQLQSSELASDPNLMIIKHESVSLRKLASSLSADNYKRFPQKADLIRGDVQAISSSDKVNEVSRLAVEAIHKEIKTESRRESRSFLQSSEDQAQVQPVSTSTHDFTATTPGKNPHVDDSAAFHMDYNDPQTHPPTNN